MITPFLIALGIVIFPSDGFMNPAINLNNIVFPDPFGPTNPVIDPFQR